MTANMNTSTVHTQQKAEMSASICQNMIRENIGNNLKQVTTTFFFGIPAMSGG